MGLSRLRPPIRVRVYGRHTMNKINARSRHELFRRLNLASLRHKKKKKKSFIFLPVKTEMLPMVPEGTPIKLSILTLKIPVSLDPRIGSKNGKRLERICFVCPCYFEKR